MFNLLILITCVIGWELFWEGLGYVLRQYRISKGLPV